MVIVSIIFINLYDYIIYIYNKYNNKYNMYIYTLYVI